MITPIFHPGQQVVCTDASFVILHAQNSGITVPQQDQVYTIGRNLQFTMDVGVLLAEISNEPIAGSNLEPNFSQSRFRALLPQEVLHNQDSELATA